MSMFGIFVQVDKVVVLWTANTERYSNVSLFLCTAQPAMDTCIGTASLDC